MIVNAVMIVGGLVLIATPTGSYWAFVTGALLFLAGLMRAVFHGVSR